MYDKEKNQNYFEAIQELATMIYNSAANAEETGQTNLPGIDLAKEIVNRVRKDMKKFPSFPVTPYMRRVAFKRLIEKYRELLEFLFPNTQTYINYVHTLNESLNEIDCYSIWSMVRSLFVFEGFSTDEETGGTPADYILKLKNTHFEEHEIKNFLLDFYRLGFGVLASRKLSEPSGAVFASVLVVTGVGTSAQSLNTLIERIVEQAMEIVRGEIDPKDYEGGDNE